jgi:hypothetical protein
MYVRVRILPSLPATNRLLPSCPALPRLADPLLNWGPADLLEWLDKAGFDG